MRVIINYQVLTYTFKYQYQSFLPWASYASLRHLTIESLRAIRIKINIILYLNQQNESCDKKEVTHLGQSGVGNGMVRGVKPLSVFGDLIGRFTSNDFRWYMSDSFALK